jgi:hypothetical protein
MAGLIGQPTSGIARHGAWEVDARHVLKARSAVVFVVIPLALRWGRGCTQCQGMEVLTCA